MNTTKTLSKYRHRIALAIFIFLTVCGLSGMVLAAPAASDYKKNFLYKPACTKGTKGPDLSVVYGRQDTTVIACIRLIGNNDGYTITPLPPPNSIVSNDSCTSSGGIGGSGSSSEVYTVDNKAFGFFCVTVTNASRWDFTGYKTPLDNTDSTADISCATVGTTSGPSNNCLLFKKYIIPAIDFLSIGVGVVVTAVVISGGIQYSTAGGDPAKVAAARKRLFNAGLALLAYIFLWAFLQWIIPGGIL